MAAALTPAFAALGATSFRPSCLTPAALRAPRCGAPLWRTSTRVRRPGALRMVIEPIASPSLLTTKRRMELAATIVNGPVFPNTGMKVGRDGEPDRFEEWLNLGAFLEGLLGAQSTDVRVYQYYLPVFFWVERELARHKAAAYAAAGTEIGVRPMIIGFSCPQGGGKTTMTTFISELLAKQGERTVIASMDDFYVPHARQREIADMNEGNRLMEHRGMPGTHDLDLLVGTLDTIREFCKAGDCRADVVQVPRFDKSLHGGRGDRMHRKDWKTIPGSVDVMLLEGWCMGFEPVPEVEEDLKVVNEKLADYAAVYNRLDGMLVIEIEDMEWVYGWRMEAERAMRAAGRPGLTDDQVKDFVGRFMPAYKHYSPGLYCRKTAICEGHELHIKIDHERRPVWR